MNDGGPAFPTHDYPEGGLTMRDWFAADAPPLQLPRCNPPLAGIALIRQQAKFNYVYADAMLAAREKGQSDG